MLSPKTTRASGLWRWTHTELPYRGPETQDRGGREVMNGWELISALEATKGAPT